MMSNGSHEIARVRQARHILERLRARLLRPTFESLEASAADLNLAVDCLGQIDVSLKSAIWQGATRAKIESEVIALRHTVHAVEALLQSAGKFYAGLARLMAPDEAPANYTASGISGPPVVATAGTVELQA